MDKNRLQTKRKEILSKHYHADAFHNEIGDIFNINDPLFSSEFKNDINNYANGTTTVLDNTKTEETKKEGPFLSRLFGTLESGLNVADHAADTINSFKNPDGSNTGVDVTTSFGGDPQPESNMKTWYIVGGVLVAAVVIGVVVTKK